MWFFFWVPPLFSGSALRSFKMLGVGKAAPPQFSAPLRIYGQWPSGRSPVFYSLAKAQWNRSQIEGWRTMSQITREFSLVIFLCSGQALRRGGGFDCLCSGWKCLSGALRGPLWDGRLFQVYLLPDRNISSGGPEMSSCRR